jgi:hypothetical protein
MKETYTILKYLQRRIMVPIAVTASLISVFAFASELFPKNMLSVAVGVMASALGAILAFSMAEALRFVRSKQTIFVSYTHADTKFVNILIDMMSDLNVRFLVDRFELKVGDNIKTAVDSMIDAADSIIFVVSKTSTESNWAQKELEQAITRKKKILPVVLDRDAIPEPLSGLYYADFSENPEIGFEQLRKTLGRR